MAHSAGDGRRHTLPSSQSPSGPNGTKPPGGNLLKALRTRWKDALLVLLALSSLTLGALLWRQVAPSAALEPSPPGEPSTSGDAVSVLDVVLDRERRQFIEILFDGPVAADEVGEILNRPPATLSPSVGGSWRWKDKAVLRFDASDRLPMATEFQISLISVRLEAAGKSLQGDRDFTLQTDPFLVDRLEIREEPADAEGDRVFFTGRLHFNYPVDPRELATRVRLHEEGGDEARAIDVQLQTTWARPVIEFRTDPVTKGLKARTLRFTVFRDLTPSMGNATLPEDFIQEVPLGSVEVLEVRGSELRVGEKESVLGIRVSSPLVPEMAARYLTLDPPLETRISSTGNDLLVAGPFQHGRSYTVTLREGLPARDEAVLPDAWATTFRVPDLEPTVDFQSEGLFLPRSGIRRVALSTVNVPTVELVVERVYLNNLFYLFQYHGFSSGGTAYRGSRVHRALGGTLREEELAIQGERNRTTITPLDLREILGAGEPGLYRLAVNRPGEWRAAQRLLLLTDIGVVAKRWEGGFMVWASSFTDLSAVAGAKVRLISDQNQLLAGGVTSATGMWRTDSLESGPDAPRPYLVTLERGGDFTFLLLDRMKVDTTGLDVAGSTLSGEGYSAFLYGERDLYRPGETVEGAVILRDAALKAPPPMPVVLRHTDPMGMQGRKLTLKSDRRGMAAFDFSLPDHAPTGRHRLELLVAEEVVGQYGFQVEEFVPDRISVEIASSGAAPGPGEDLNLDVTGAYLFGAPGSGLPVEVRVRLEDATFAPRGYEAFTFRNGERKFARREILSTEGRLDDDGRGAFSVKTPGGLQAPSSLEAVITARVSEPGGRGVTGLARRAVHPYPYYPGLKKGFEGYAEPGKSSAFEFVAVDPSGKETAAGDLRAELYRDRWNTVLRRLPSGNYRYESSRDPVLVDTLSIPGGKARGTFEFPIPQYGSFRVVLTDIATQASAQVEFYASGWGYSPWAISNPSRIELELDRDEYRPGDQAKVLVKAPFPGRLLLSVERGALHHASVHRLEGNTAELTVPVTAAMRPNAYVTATLVRGSGDLEPGAVARAYGAVPIAVDRTSNRLEVAVKAPERMRSHRTLEVEVRSRPGSAVSVAAVDEGILQLIAQETPDPFSWFYRKLALQASTHDTYALLLPQVHSSQSGPAGGDAAGGVRAQYLRTDGMRRAEPVAFWSGILDVDSSGKATARFQIPEFQGAVRVMAVSAEGRRFGSASHKVQVRDPIVVTPSPPRFLAPRESFQLPVTVRNDTGREATLRVRLETDGPVTLRGAATREIQVADGREGTVHFDLATGESTGAVSLAIHAEGNGESSRAAAALPVRAELPRQTRESSGAFRDAETTLSVSDPSWARAGTLRRDLRIGPLPLVQFSGKLEGLLRYPYGCLEQTVSSAFPLLYLEDLARALVPDLFDGREGHASPAELVQAGIERLRLFRLSDGAFSLWPGSGVMDPWATIYAAHFLVEARQAGYWVDDFMHDGAVEYLSSSLSSSRAPDLKRLAYSLYVLARAGKADTAMMDHVRSKRLDEMQAESRALLAAAYALTGSPSAVDDLLDQVSDADRVERRTGGNLDSTVRNRALILLALLEAKPSDPRVAGLVERLTRELSASSWWSTQDSAFTLLAVGRFVRSQQEKGSFSGEVYAGAKKIGSFGSTPVAFSGIQGTEPLRVVMAGGFQAGAAYYSVSERGIPTDAAYRAGAEGIEIERALLDREGEPVDPEAVRQGDLIVLRTRIRSVEGPMENVVIQQLLPSGMEVENPRLKTTEGLPWMAVSNLPVDYLDLRDDRILVFVRLPRDKSWETVYALLRAVTPGEFRLPPLQAEAMYNGAFRASGAPGSMTIIRAGEGGP